MSLEIRTLTGANIAGGLDALADLRTRVFRDWPYLYDGDPANERAYLAGYAAAPMAVLILAEDAGTPVGAATAMPLAAMTTRQR